MRTQIIARGALAASTERYWEERTYATQLLDAAESASTLVLMPAGHFLIDLVVEKMDIEWENSWFLPQREKIRCDIINTITDELSRMGIKITGRTRDGVLVNSISHEKSDEITMTVRHLYPGIVTATRYVDV